MNDLDTSSYTDSSTGSESDTDTATGVAGTVTISGSGSSSQLTHQVFGDILGSGGVIASGSLSYTVSSSDTDADSTTDSGTETLSDEVSHGPSQTASYSTTESSPDDETAYETGTETLGAGGTISGGTASFGWSVGNSLSRNLGVSGISATLTIKETSTDTYGFGESGTETITTGGADAPGTGELRLEPDGNGQLPDSAGKHAQRVVYPHVVLSESDRFGEFFLERYRHRFADRRRRGRG